MLCFFGQYFAQIIRLEGAVKPVDGPHALRNTASTVRILEQFGSTNWIYWNSAHAELQRKHLLKSLRWYRSTAEDEVVIWSLVLWASDQGIPKPRRKKVEFHIPRAVASAEFSAIRCRQAT